MGYDRGDNFPLDFEPNEIPFGSKSKLNCQHDHIPFNLIGNGNIVFSVCMEARQVLNRHLEFLLRNIWNFLWNFYRGFT